MFKTVGPILFICKCDTKYFAHHPNCPPPPLPKRFIRPCDVIGAFSGGHKAIFRLDAPSTNRRRKTRRVLFRIHV